jgi:hypothetical protein
VRPTDLDWPCNNVVPGIAPVAVILARTEETVVAVTGIRAFPTGFGFTQNLRLRNLHPRERRGFWPFPELGRHRGPPWSDEVLRLTIQFADGRSVTNLDPAPRDREVPAFEQPMLSRGSGTGQVGSGSSADRWAFDMDYRARPCPHPGRWPSSANGQRAASHPRGSRSTARPSSGRPRPRCACGPTTRTAPPTDASRQSERNIEGDAAELADTGRRGFAFAQTAVAEGERIPSPRENR